ncbi:MAG: sporulation protein YabP [Clostridia bacterium]|nr:sporulation protein YabP [Clostridia bacterium]
MMEDKRGEYTLSLVNREMLQINGVNNVVSYDEAEILIQTVLGVLVVKGEGLHITNLNLEDGKLAVEGYINKLEYQEDKGAKLRDKSKGIFSKLIR